MRTHSASAAICASESLSAFSLLHGCCLGQICDHPAWWTLTDRAGAPRWPAVPFEIAFNLAALGGFWWLRREVRKRLNLSGPDPLEAQLDEELGISRRNGFLQLQPESARLRPKE